MPWKEAQANLNLAQLALYHSFSLDEYAVALNAGEQHVEASKLSGVIYCLPILAIIQGWLWLVEGIDLSVFYIKQK